MFFVNKFILFIQIIKPKHFRPLKMLINEKTVNNTVCKIMNISSHLFVKTCPSSNWYRTESCITKIHQWRKQHYQYGDIASPSRSILFLPKTVATISGGLLPLRFVKERSVIRSKILAEKIPQVWQNLK